MFDEPTISFLRMLLPGSGRLSTGRSLSVRRMLHRMENRMIERAYQTRSVAAVNHHWSAGVLAVLLVAPTGAGKSHMGEDLVAEATSRGETILWVCHQRELVEQAAARLIERFGFANVGIIMPGARANPIARIQVGSTQTLRKRAPLRSVRVVVLDEAHHYAAADWRLLAEGYQGVRCVGLTATSKRADGTPLGDIFGALVAETSYSELIAAGHLVPVCLYRPARILGSDLAEDPVDAWRRLSGGAQTFMFCARVESAKKYARRLREDVGIQAAMISGEMSRVDRADLISKFRRGAIRVLTCANVLTEGIDVPDCGCVVLAKSYLHETPYIQATGRGLRSAPNKKVAIVIDLTGSSWREGLGLPTDDRAYSLEGREVAVSEKQVEAAIEREDFAQSVLGEPLVHVGVSFPVAPIEPILSVPNKRHARTSLTVRPIEVT